MFKNSKKAHRLSIALLVLAFLVCLCFTLAASASEEPQVLTTGTQNTSLQEESSNQQKATSDDKTNSEALADFLEQTGVKKLVNSADWKPIVMILISFVLMYLAIGKGFEPLLLLPIAFGMLLTNLPGAGMFHSEIFEGGHINWSLIKDGITLPDGSTETAGLIDILYLGVKLGIYPCLIFIGVGAMTDFAPLIANPKSLFLGAAAQLGIFVAFILANSVLGFNQQEAGSIGIIGGADGPTAIYTTSLLSPELLGPIAIAAYSYMALVPVIQPPIMRGLTTKKERLIRMDNLRTVSKKEKIIFPIAVTAFVALILPSAVPLIGCLMLGNLFRECGVTERLAKTAQNELMNIVVIFLGVSVGATAKAESFLDPKTLGILALGIFAFAGGSAGGVLLAKFMNLFLPEGKKINPLIGSAGVSAVPMAARVSQKVGQKDDPSNFLLMHAMGPNVAGVIGSAVAAGVFIALLGG
ncbi:MAG: sodium ion-translocating decarboxylase subunit beta [Ruminococcaceae bacterium]|nr:sodium ion-translocating decarboxylase subunit beta [Oscillospiraceae bacterium]